MVLLSALVVLTAKGRENLPLASFQRLAVLSVVPIHNSIRLRIDKLSDCSNIHNRMESEGDMNKPMLAAGGLMAITYLVHVFAGGPEIHHAIQASDLTLELRAISAIIWHMVTVILSAFAVALLWLAIRQNRALAWLTIVVQLGFAGLFLFYGLTMLGSPWPMPQWIAFLLIPALTLLGLRKRVS